MDVPTSIVNNPQLLTEEARMCIFASTGPFSEQWLGRILEMTFMRLSAKYNEPTIKNLYNWANRYVVNQDAVNSFSAWHYPITRIRQLTKKGLLPFEPLLSEHLTSIIIRYDNSEKFVEYAFLAEQYYKAERDGKLADLLEELGESPITGWEKSLTGLIQEGIGDFDVATPVSFSFMNVVSVVNHKDIVQIWQVLSEELSAEEIAEFKDWSLKQMLEVGTPAIVAEKAMELPFLKDALE